MDWDTSGRLWVVEMPGFMADLTGSNEHEPIGRVVVLEDTNADGRMDKRTVFADRLVLARSIKVLDRGVLIAEPPNVWLMSDVDGDLKADQRTLVTDRYGRRDADPQNNANGFLWALDNRMYTAGQADIHLRLTDGALRDDADAAARRVGRHRRRRRPDLSQHERIGGARRPGADALLRAQSQSRPHARQLRAARHRQRRPEHRLAGPAESGHQPRLPDRHRSPGRHAGQVHVRLCADGLSRRPAAGRTLRQRVRGRTGGQPRVAARARRWQRSG